MKHSVRALAALAALAVSFVVAPAFADDDEAAALATRGKALRYNAKSSEPSTSKVEWGGAAILVNAPIAQVRQVVMDYRNYDKFMKPFDSSKLISKKNGVSEVYFQVPVMHGAAKIWAVVKTSAPAKDGDGEKIVLRYVKGNVDDFAAVWRLRPTEDGRTVLKLELLVDPTMPLPNSMVTGELKYAADKAVTAVRDRLEKIPDADKKPSNVAKR
jgi:ribosome-associated toxin RatA of RatAB toxin-antitoxin module